MPTLSRIAVAALSGALFVHAPARAGENDPLGLALIETPDLRLVYLAPSLQYLTPHIIRTFVNAERAQRARFGWEPTQPVTIFLKDFADYGNAGATPLPLNSMRVEVSPASNAFETNPSAERFYSLMNHETVHVATGDVASSEDRFWRRVFLGKVAPQPSNPESLLYSYLTTPRFNVPRWLLEGSAVFMETWMGGGLGRAQGGYDEMVFRAMVRDNASFYDPLGLESRGVRVDFQVGVNAYLYGTRFLTWLSLEYSPEKVVQWLRRDEGSLRHYSDAFEQVFGLPLGVAWQRWIDAEANFQHRNLAEVRKVPITPMKALTPRPVGSSSRVFYDKERDTLYGAFRQAGIVEYVGALNLRNGSIKKLGDIKGGVLFSVTSLAFDAAHRKLFFTNDNFAYRSIVELDIDTGRQTELMKDARIGELVFDPDDGSLFGVRHQSGLATLVRIPYPYRTWIPLHTFDYGVVPSDLDVSPDGKRLSASVNEINGDQFVRVWSIDALANERFEQSSECGFGQSFPEGFVFSPDGRYLYGSSYFTGVSNIFRCEPATGKTEAVTNAEVGLFRPVPLNDGRLAVLEYTGRGLLPSVLDPKPLDDVSAVRFLGNEVVAKHPVVKTWQVPPPDTVDDSTLVTHRGIYRPLEHVGLYNGYPVLQGYKHRTGLGYQLNGGDWLGFASVGATIAFTPQEQLSAKERAHAEVTGRYLGWDGSLSWNRSNFYDIFGPTERSRKGFAAKLGYDLPLIFELPRRLDLRVDLAHYAGIDTLPQNQNVASGVTILSTAEVGLHYTDLRKSLGAVDDEKGVAASGILSTSYADGTLVPQLRGGLDVGVALPWDHASLWSRTSLGTSRGDRENTFANYYFGGFGNNRVDKGTVRRYRDYDSMPGFEIGELSGKSFVRQQVELTLPPYVFSQVGAPDAHLTWLRGAVFATGLWTNPPGFQQTRRTFASLGAQADLRFSVLHWYEMILSVGYGQGFAGGRKGGNEWMVSLKIM